MRRVFPSSKPPDGGYPPSFRLLAGGTQLRGSWYLSAIVRLQGFSSGAGVVVVVVRAGGGECHTRFWKANRMRTMYVLGSELTYTAIT